MKRQRTTKAALASIILGMGILAGCTSEKDSPAASPATSPVATKSTTTVAKENDRTKFDPPVTITGAIALKPSDKLRNGDTPENNPISRWFKDTLGIVTKYQWVVTDGAALETKVRLSLTSGEALPDVLTASGTLFEDLVASKRIQTVDEAFEKYATPRVKESYQKNPDVWNLVKRNGKLYGLPALSNGIVGNTVMWIREDWLKKLNLKAPTNVQEYEAVMDAFTNNDPDGNGKKDTYGMAFGANTGYHKPTMNFMTDASFIFGQDQPYQWLKGTDGKLQYGSTRPGVKDALGKLHEWFSKGYISPDFGTQDGAKAMADFTSGKAGITFAPGWAGGWPVGTAVNEAKTKNQALDIKPYPIPAGIKGEVGRAASLPSYGIYVFREGFTNMEAVFKYWDTMYGCSVEDAACPFANGKGEGYDYVMKDGKPDWKNIPDGTLSLNAYQLISPGTGTAPTNVMPGPNIYQRVAAGKKDNVFEQKLAAENGQLTIEGFSVAFQQLNKDVQNGFFGANTPTMKDKWEQLIALEEQAFLQIIYGKQKPDYFDTFVKQWNDQGGAQITKEVNEYTASIK